MMTIVVLLILAVVAINAITKDDILGKAEDATKKYNQAVENEKGTLNYYEAYLAGTIGKWVQDKTTVSKITPEGTITLNVGQTVTGYSAPEGIEDPGWAVLGAENGRLLLISKINVSELEVGSGVRYWEVKETLDENAIKFKGELADNARGITGEDINRITGYVTEKNDNGTIYGYDYEFNEYIAEESDAYKLLNDAKFWTGERFYGSSASDDHEGIIWVCSGGTEGVPFIGRGINTNGWTFTAGVRPVIELNENVQVTQEGVISKK